MTTIDDDEFGTLEWDNNFQEWSGKISIGPHEIVGLGLPIEYAELAEVRRQVQEVMQTIRREELDIRERAADQLFAEGGYVFWWLEDKPFDRDEFVREMYLAMITFDLETPEIPLALYYEYTSKGMEHGIIIVLTWEGEYQYARET